MKIRTWGDPVLRQPGAKIEQVDDALLALVDDMLQTMYDAPGVGLAAQQVGVLLQVFVYDAGEGPGVVLNPEIEVLGGEWTYDEGCLSVPGLYFPIQRPDHVRLTGFDLDMNPIDIEGGELLGRIFQHEYDHLQGKLLLDRLEPDMHKQAMRVLRERAMQERAGA